LFSSGKNQRFDSRWSNDSLQTLCLGVLAIDILIYTEKIKSETDLREMVEIMEELLKIKKNDKDTFSHAQASEKKNKK
jgi:hypothetical protein